MTTFTAQALQKLWGRVTGRNA